MSMPPRNHHPIKRDTGPTFPKVPSCSFPITTPLPFSFLLTHFCYLPIGVEFEITDLIQISSDYKQEN